MLIAKNGIGYRKKYETLSIYPNLTKLVYKSESLPFNKCWNSVVALQQSKQQFLRQFLMCFFAPQLFIFISFFCTCCCSVKSRCNHDLRQFEQTNNIYCRSVQFGFNSKTNLCRASKRFRTDSRQETRMEEEKTHFHGKDDSPQILNYLTENTVG